MKTFLQLLEKTILLFAHSMEKLSVRKWEKVREVPLIHNALPLGPLLKKPRILSSLVVALVMSSNGKVVPSLKPIQTTRVPFIVSA